MKTINKFFALIKLEMKKYLIYPVAAISGIVAGIIDMFVFYFVWKAIYNGQNIFNGITYGQMMTYIVLARILFQMFSYGANTNIAKIIRNGDISIELIRPMSFFKMQLGIRFGHWVIEFLITGVAMAIVGAIFLDFALPISIGHFVLFVISIFLAVILGFVIEFICGIVIFYTVSAWGIQCFKQAIIAFFSGSVVPIEFMPTALANFTNALPFKSMVSFPIMIYLGNISANEIIMGFATQIAWIVGLIIFANIFFKIAIRKVIIAGG